ncbi:MAG: cytochrome C552 [Proteobacteria bacterium]|nr:cytochrome C552 [Pseudomonadota bacterium]
MRAFAALLLGCTLSMAALPVSARVVGIELPADVSVLRASPLPGYTVAQQKCGICHSADYVNFQPPGMDLEQWTAEMNKMQHSYGAALDELELRLVAAYLAVTYGTAQATDPQVLALSVEARKASEEKVLMAKGASIDVPALLNANACLCHAIDQKLVGPAFKEVAAAYRGETDAQAKVVTSIRQGVVGQWGPVPMPAMSTLSDAQLNALAEFVLKQ